MAFDHITQIMLPGTCWQSLVAHCERKLLGKHEPGESKARKAYGIIAGKRDGDQLLVERIVLFKKNVRDQEPFKTYMDGMMTRHAVPSKTPLAKRGWMTDPQELKACYDMCDREDLIVLGTYHMHVVPWEHDYRRDTPTRLDTVLAKGSGLFSFIISMVDVDNPSIRAFYEGITEAEVPIHILEERMVETG